MVRNTSPPAGGYLEFSWAVVLGFEYLHAGEDRHAIAADFKLKTDSNLHVVQEENWASAASQE